MKTQVIMAADPTQFTEKVNQFIGGGSANIEQLRDSGGVLSAVVTTTDQNNISTILVGGYGVIETYKRVNEVINGRAARVFEPLKPALPPHIYIVVDIFTAVPEVSGPLKELQEPTPEPPSEPLKAQEETAKKPVKTTKNQSTTKVDTEQEVVDEEEKKGESRIGMPSTGGKTV